MTETPAKTRHCTFAVQTRAENENRELYVEGYAVRFDSPTVLFEIDGVEYREQIAHDAFADAQMQDVIFNYNHTGAVMARTRNHTLQLTVDAEGLYVRARVDGTTEGRSLYEAIAGGYIDRMSFAFTVREESYDSATHLWTVQKVKRLYDVSAVSIPAYEDTSISARKHDACERVAQEMARKKVRMKCKL